MKKAFIIFGLIFAVCAFSQTAYAEEKEMQSGKPWKKFTFSVGGFFNALDSSVRLGTKTIGVEADVEDALGFDSFDLGVEAENSDNVAGVDFAGNIKFNCFGAMLYVKAFF